MIVRVLGQTLGGLQPRSLACSVPLGDLIACCTQLSAQVKEEPPSLHTIEPLKK